MGFFRYAIKSAAAIIKPGVASVSRIFVSSGMIRVSLISSLGLAIALSALSVAVDAQESGRHPMADMRKAAIEGPVKRLLSQDRQSLSNPATKPQAQSTAFSNPKVKPGLVKWHADFASACAASRSSGKPVLLFHMMGKLDDGFC